MLATPELVDLFLTEENRVAEALTQCREPLVRAADIIAEALRKGGRLFYVGAGTSGRLGVLDASEIPPTFGASPELVQGIIAGGAHALHRAVEGAEDEPEAGALAVYERGVRAGDVVCGLTASGRTPFVLGALKRGRELKARTILMTCNPARHRAESAWDVEIDLPTGPEIVTGSTRLKAGTATKVALNILSTCAMIRLGKVRGNTMIDLRISNEKLQDRGIRVVSEMLAIPYAEARARLESSGWNVRRCLEQAGAEPQVMWCERFMAAVWQINDWPLQPLGQTVEMRSAADFGADGLPKVFPFVARLNFVLWDAWHSRCLRAISFAKANGENNPNREAARPDGFVRRTGGNRQAMAGRAAFSPRKKRRASAIQTAKSSAKLPLPQPFRSEQDAGGFIERLLPLHLRHGIRHDAGADVKVDASRLGDHGADGDVELAFAVETQPAHRARVEAARPWLEFRDDFAGALFRRAGDRAAGKTFAQGLDVMNVRAERAFDGGDEMKHLLEAFEREHFAHGDAAGLADAAEVASFQIGDHDQLGDFLRGGEKIVGGFFIGVLIRAARARALDRPGADVAAGHFEERFRRGAEDPALAERQVTRERRGRVMPQGEIEGEGIPIPRGGEAVGEVYLIDVAGGDVLLGAGNHRAELRARHFRDKARRWRARRRIAFAPQLRRQSRRPRARCLPRGGRRALPRTGRNRSGHRIR